LVFRLSTRLCSIANFIRSNIRNHECFLYHYHITLHCITSNLNLTTTCLNSYTKTSGVCRNILNVTLRIKCQHYGFNHMLYIYRSVDLNLPKNFSNLEGCPSCGHVSKWLNQSIFWIYKAISSSWWAMFDNNILPLI